MYIVLNRNIYFEFLFREISEFFENLFFSFRGSSVDLTRGYPKVAGGNFLLRIVIPVLTNYPSYVT